MEELSASLSPPLNKYNPSSNQQIDTFRVIICPVFIKRISLNKGFLGILKHFMDHQFFASISVR